MAPQGHSYLQSQPIAMRVTYCLQPTLSYTLACSAFSLQWISQIETFRLAVSSIVIEFKLAKNIS